MGADPLDAAAEATDCGPMTMTEREPRYYVQGETVRGEPRLYWVMSRLCDEAVTRVTRDRRQAERWMARFEAAVATLADGEQAGAAKDET